LIFQYVKRSRIRLSADRGFPDDDLFTLLDELEIDYTIRVKGSVKVFYRGKWVKLNTIRFEAARRRRNLGRLYYCEKSPRQLWVTTSRARNKKGQFVSPFPCHFPEIEMPNTEFLNHLFVYC